MKTMSENLLLRLYGPFSLTFADGTEIPVRSEKQKIILANLVTSPDFKRSRTYLEDMLWSITGREQAQGNLRQAVLSLKRLLNSDGREIIFADNSNIWLDCSAVQLVGGADHGTFLEGINLTCEPEFVQWVKLKRTESIGAHLIDSSSFLRPTIAVLPFVKLGAEPGGFGISDMFAESLIHTLSRSSLINVISHLSTSSFTQKAISMDIVRDQLKADNVITGRLNVHGDQVRVETETIHVQSGQIKGGHSSTFSLHEYLNSDSSIIGELAAQIGRSLFSNSIAASRANPLNEVACHDLMMASVHQMHRQSLRGFSEARQQLEEVTRRIPNASIPFAWLAKWYVLSIIQGWSMSATEDHMAKAMDNVARALDLNPGCSFALTVDGFIQNNLLKRYDTAMNQYEEALSIEPNNPLSWLLKGTLLAFMGEGKEAVLCTQRARKLSPLDPHKYFFDSLSATAALSNRDYEGALSLAEYSLSANRNHVSTRRVKTIALHQLGRMGEARQSAGEILKIDQSFTINKYLQNHAAASFETGREWAKALKGAGIPEA